MSWLWLNLQMRFESWMFDGLHGIVFSYSRTSWEAEILLQKHTKFIFMKAHYETFQSKNYADLLYIWIIIFQWSSTEKLNLFNNKFPLKALVSFITAYAFSEKLHSFCFCACWRCSWSSDRDRCLKGSESCWCCKAAVQSGWLWWCFWKSDWMEGWWTRWVQALDRSPLTCRWSRFLPGKRRLYGLELQERKRKLYSFANIMEGFGL